MNATDNSPLPSRGRNGGGHMPVRLAVATVFLTAPLRGGGFVEVRRLETGAHSVLSWADPAHMVCRMRTDVQMLDTATWQPVWRVGKSGPAAFAARHFVAGTTVRETRTGRELGTLVPPRKYNNYPTGMAISADGRLLAVAVGADWRVDLHQLPAGTALTSLRTEDRVRGVAFSPTEAVLAVSDAGAGIRLLDVRNPKQVRPVNRDFQDSLGTGTLAFSPDGRLLAAYRGSSRTNAWIHVYDVATGRAVRRIRDLVHRESEVVFSPDGRWLAASGVWHLDPTRKSSWHAAVRVWDVGTGRVVSTVTDLRIGGVSPPLRFAFSPNGDQVAVASDRVPPGGGVLIVWQWDADGAELSGIVGTDSRPAARPQPAGLASLSASRNAEARRLLERSRANPNKGRHRPAVENPAEYRDRNRLLIKITQDYADTPSGRSAASSLKAFARRFADTAPGREAAQVVREYENPDTRYSHVVPQIVDVLRKRPGTQAAEEAAVFLHKVAENATSPTGKRAAAAVLAHESRADSAPGRPVSSTRPPPPRPDRDAGFTLDVAVTTSRGKNAGSDKLKPAVRINCDPAHQAVLDNPDVNDFERGAVDVFKGLQFGIPLSEVETVRLVVLGGDDAWHLKTVLLQFSQGGRKTPPYAFAVDAWFSADRSDVGGTAKQQTDFVLDPKPATRLK